MSLQSEDGKVLADIIKNVHRRLRQELKESGDSESSWINHCRNEARLKVYIVNQMVSMCMKVTMECMHVG